MADARSSNQKMIEWVSSLASGSKIECLCGRVTVEVQDNWRGMKCKEPGICLRKFEVSADQAIEIENLGKLRFVVG